MKIVLAGDWSSELHEEPVACAFEELGHAVIRFPWRREFGLMDPVLRVGRGDWIGRFQNKLLWGPVFDKVNADLVETVRHEKPDLLFVYRGTHVTASALRRVTAESPRTLIVGLNNDDPFAPGASKLLWRHFISAIPHYDILLAYRHANVADFKRSRAKRVELLRSWYCPARNYPVKLADSDEARFSCDVVFAGHYEPDGRLECLEAIAEQGWSLRLFGPGEGYRGFGWNEILRRSPALRRLAPVNMVWGQDYNKALCGAKTALCFLSKLNRDTYTRRCFEIPASGTMLLSERSEDLERLFKPGVEADFFASPAELVRKLKLYLGDDRLRMAVANAGRHRVIAGGHDVKSRMSEVLRWVAETSACGREA